MVIYYMKVKFYLEKETEQEKNMIMGKLDMKENIKMEKEMEKEKNIMKIIN